MSYLRYLYLFTYNDVQHILCCVFCFVCLRLYPMLPVSLDCPFLIVPSVFSNAYLDIYSDLDFQRYLSPLFRVQWVKVRGDYLSCRYWWSCCPSLFKRSFHNCHRNKGNGTITLPPWIQGKERGRHSYIYFKLTNKWTTMSWSIKENM